MAVAFWHKVQTENWLFPTLLRNGSTSVTWNTFWLNELHIVVINVIYHHRNTKGVLLTMPHTYFCYFMSHLCWMNLYFIINVTLSSKNLVFNFNIIVLIFEVLMAVIIKILSSEMWCHAVTKKLFLFYRDLLPPFLHFRDRLFQTEDGSSTFCQNMENFYHTTWCYITEDNILDTV